MAITSQDMIEYFRLEGARNLLKLYGRYQDNIPDDASEWRKELFPVVRGIWNSEMDGGRNRYEIGAQLRTAADLFEIHPDGSHHALKNFPTGHPKERTAAIFREIADYVEQWASPLDREAISNTPITARELIMRFPRLSNILPLYFGQDGAAVSDDMQDASTEEGIRMYIDETHPGCPWNLPAAVAECHEALAIFHTEDQLDRFFCGAGIHGGSGSDDFTDFLPLFARLCSEHMREFHSPMWEPR
ncbi:hypothetical protein [Streptomyces sp. NPDC058086]|uniref:hypothetical protein n=1 Tax=Streptomyces sp. NPDC058086 TaxID=3346334 RepID=UPI0036E93683